MLGHSCVFPCATPTVGDIGNDIVGTTKHPLISIVDGKSPWDGLHPLRVHGVFWRKIRWGRKVGQNHSIKNMGVGIRQVCQNTADNAVELPLTADIEDIHIFIFNQVNQYTAQILLNGFRTLPVAKKVQVAIKNLRIRLYIAQ